jgi:FG-GAP repeat
MRPASLACLFLLVAALSAQSTRVPLTDLARSGSDDANMLLGAKDAAVLDPLDVDPFRQQAELTAPDAVALDSFGDSLALSSDGTTALVGASGETVGSNAYQGAVYVFKRVDESRSLEQELTASDGAAGDEFSKVAISRDGKTALVGAYLKSVGSNRGQGAV